MTVGLRELLIVALVAAIIGYFVSVGLAGLFLLVAALVMLVGSRGRW